MMKNTIKMKGTYTFVCKDKEGNIKDTWSVDNLVTNAGIAQMALLAGDATAIPFTYVALGTSNTSPAASQTTLVAEIVDSGLARVAGTVSRTTTTVTNDTLQILASFSISGTKTVEEIGVFNASSSGTMLSRALTGTKSFVSGEVYEITYKLKFS